MPKVVEAEVWGVCYLHCRTPDSVKVVKELPPRRAENENGCLDGCGWSEQIRIIRAPMPSISEEGGRDLPGMPAATPIRAAGPALSGEPIREPWDSGIRIIRREQHR